MLHKCLRDKGTNVVCPTQPCLGPCGLSSCSLRAEVLPYSAHHISSRPLPVPAVLKDGATPALGACTAEHTGVRCEADLEVGCSPRPLSWAPAQQPTGSGGGGAGGGRQGELGGGCGESVSDASSRLHSGFTTSSRGNTKHKFWTRCQETGLKSSKLSKSRKARKARTVPT